MSAHTLRPEERTETLLKVEGIWIRLTTFKLGELYHSSIDNVDPGAVLVRAESAKREEAEARAVDGARKELLANNHVH